MGGIALPTSTGDSKDGVFGHPNVLVPGPGFQIGEMGVADGDEEMAHRCSVPMEDIKRSGKVT